MQNLNSLSLFVRELSRIRIADPHGRTWQSYCSDMLLLNIIRVIRVTMRQVRELHSDPEDHADSSRARRLQVESMETRHAQEFLILN
jgi:hypothetical protein